MKIVAAAVLGLVIIGLCIIVPIYGLGWRIMELQSHGELWQRTWPAMLWIVVGLYAIHLSRKGNY